MTYVYFVSYFCKSDPGILSFGNAEVVLSGPISEFDDVVGISEVVAAKGGVEAVSVLGWQLLRREEVPDDSATE